MLIRANDLRGSRILHVPSAPAVTTMPPALAPPASNQTSKQASLTAASLLQKMQQIRLAYPGTGFYWSSTMQQDIDLSQQAQYPTRRNQAL